MALLDFTERGIYCSQADLYIDPWMPVKRAIITHGHSDHARPGHGHYLSTHAAGPVIKYRLGEEIDLESMGYGESRKINGVSFSFHPAGHIIGSAQVRVQYNGEVWVVSGDYKTENDGYCEAFEPVQCDVFVTECTFGLPVYRWPEQQDVFRQINKWWASNAEMGRTTILTGYALGKAQRLLCGLDLNIGPVFTHGAVENVNQVLRNQGIALPPTTRVDENYHKTKNALILATPSALGTSWTRKFKPYSTGMASGWMAIRGMRRRRSADRGFVLSDHADWEGLNSAIRETGASRVIVTHGYTHLFSRWLNENGIQASVESALFEGDEDLAE